MISGSDWAVYEWGVVKRSRAVQSQVILLVAFLLASGLIVTAIGDSPGEAATVGLVSASFILPIWQAWQAPTRRHDLVLAVSAAIVATVVTAVLARLGVNLLIALVAGYGSGFIAYSAVAKWLMSDSRQRS